MVPKPGYNAGIAKAGRAARIGWTLKAAPLRKKDMRVTPLVAVAEARKLRDAITAKLKPEINPEDGIVQLVFAKHDLSAPPTVWSIGVSPAKDGAIAAKFAELLPIGFLVWVWDREAKEIYGHARPLIVEDPRSLELNAMALTAAEKKLRLSLAADGLLPDFRN